ncbi:MAG: hypothetical protein GY937_05655, partial [bacterium]|nr:hypothetical protein [bacterium]
MTEIPDWAKTSAELTARPSAESAEETASKLPGSGREDDVIAQEPLGAKGFFETIEDAGSERVPIYGTAKQFGQYADLLVRARRAERGTASQHDLQLLNNWIVDQQRGHTIMGGAADIVMSLPKFLVELAAGAGVGKAAVVIGKKSAKDGTKALIKSLARRGALSATKAKLALRAHRAVGGQIVKATAKRKLAKGMGAGALAKGATVNAARGVGKVATIVGGMEVSSQALGKFMGLEDSGGIISAGAASKALGRVEWKGDEFGRFQVAMDQAIPGTLDLLPQGFIDGMIEVGTELGGGALARGAKGIFSGAMVKAGVKEIPLITKVQALQMKAAERWLGKGGKNTMDALLKIAEKGKFNGVMGEFLEERAVGVGHLLAQGVPGWEEDFDGMDGLFPGWAQAASELVAFSMVPAGAAGVGAAREFKIRRDFQNMTREEIVGAELKKRMEEAGDWEGAEAATDMGPVSSVKPLTADDVLEEDPVFEAESGFLTYDEMMLRKKQRTILGGNAFARKMVSIGFGLRGLVDSKYPGRAFDEDPVTYLQILGLVEKMYESIGGIVVMEGREENIEQDKARKRRLAGGAKGVDAGRGLLGMRKSKNIAEMMEKMAAVVVEVDLQRKEARPEGSSEYGHRAAQILKAFSHKGRSAMAKDTVTELAALGTQIEPGQIKKAKVLLQNVKEAMKAIPQEMRRKDYQIWADLLREQKAAQDEIKMAKAEAMMRGFQQFIRIELTADGAQYLPRTTKWFKDTFAANNPETYEKLMTMKELVTRFRRQGAFARQEAQSSDQGNPLTRWKKRMQLVTTPEGRRELKQLGEEEWIGSALAQREFVAALKVIARERGEELRTSQNPMLLDEAYAGRPAAINEQFILREAQTFDGKVRKDVQPLVAIGEHVKGRVKEFSKYLWARRVIALYEDVAAELGDDGKIRMTGGTANSRKTRLTSAIREGGLGVEDARHVVANAPEGFAEAADIYYKWWDSVLDYLAGSSNAGRLYVERMRASDPGDYVGLPRELIEVVELMGHPGTTMQSALNTDISKKLVGGMEPVGPVFEHVMEASLKLFDLAHAMNLNQVIADGLMRDGMQEFGNILSADQVPGARPSIGKVAEALAKAFEDQGKKEFAEQAREAKAAIGDSSPIEDPSQFIKIDGMQILADLAQQGGIEEWEQFVNTALEFEVDSLVPIKGDGRTVIPFRDEHGTLLYMDIKNDGLMRWFNHKLSPQQVNRVWSALAL